ncbi:MAG: thymidine phosphorylase [Nanoarchaeota archaeon]
MKLKVKFLKLLAGRPVAILHKNFAEKASIHTDDRIYIEKRGKKLAAVVDIATGFLKENEIVVSSEIQKIISLREKSVVEVELAVKPESLGFIQKKLSGGRLNRQELEKIMADIVNNVLTESEIAYFISGICKSDMSIEEIKDMTLAVLNTGKRLNLKGKVIDKHSIGGIPGRTTPIIVSICSTAGLLMPKTSSRAITTPSGTADAVEVICKVDFTIKEIKKILKKTNACLVWGGSLNIAPADDKIIQVERLLNLAPEAQLLSSIMAKKLAVNAKVVLIEIPYGRNAKVTRKKAEELKKKFKKLAKYFRIKLKCILKRTEEPIGNGIGPLLEISDVIKVLKGESECYKLRGRALESAGQLLELTGKAKKGKGMEMAEKILDSGKAYEKFLAIVRAQRGSINNIEKIKAKYKRDIRADKRGKIRDIRIKQLNNLARIAGCPLDKAAGIYLHKHLNNIVKKGEKILTIYSQNKTELREALRYYRKTKPIRF